MSRWAAAFHAVVAADTCDTCDTWAGRARETVQVSSCVTCVTPPASEKGAADDANQVFLERRPPRAISAELVAWYDGVTFMQWVRPPSGFTPSRWRRACLDAAGLLEAYGAELLALGWTASDVFGLHPEAPGPAVRCYGLALLLDGGRVTKLTVEGAVIVRPSGSVLRFRRGGGQSAVPAWALNNNVDKSRVVKTDHYGLAVSGLKEA